MTPWEAKGFIGWRGSGVLIIDLSSLAVLEPSTLPLWWWRCWSFSVSSFLRACQIHVHRQAHAVLYHPSGLAAKPISLLILEIGIFCLFHVSLIRGFQCWWSFQRTSSLFHWFFSVISFSGFIDFCCHLDCFFCLPAYCLWSWLLRWDLRLWIWDLPSHGGILI